MQAKATAQKPTALGNPAMMTDMVRGQIYAGLDGMQHFTIKTKEMNALVKLAEEIGDDAAADAARGALNALAAAATA
jgi:hypothetical protein